MKSINAEVAMKTLFSKLKAAIVSPLIAPPVPNKPAENPEKEPPIIAFFLLGAMLNLLLIIKIRLKTTKNTPKNISKKSLLIIFDRKPPTITKTTEGIPMFMSSFLSKPFLNKNILLKLLYK